MQGIEGDVGTQDLELAPQATRELADLRRSFFPGSFESPEGYMIFKFFFLTNFMTKTPIVTTKEKNLRKSALIRRKIANEHERILRAEISLVPKGVESLKWRV